MKSSFPEALLLISGFLIPWTGTVADEWSILGSKAMGMGGAGVASSRGSQATYWNPAALARSNGTRGTSGCDEEKENVDRGEKQGCGEQKLPPEGENGKEKPRPPWDLSAGLALTLTDSGETLGDLDDLRTDVNSLNLSTIDSKLRSGTQFTESELRLSTRIVGRDIPALDGEGDGALLDAIAGPTFRIGRFGLAFLMTMRGAADPVADYENLAFGTQGMGAVVGPGQDRSAALSSSGQSLADEFARGGSMTQNQAEELVYQAEAGGVDTSDPAARRALQSAVDATASNVGGSNENSFTQNQSGATMHGIFLQELALGYGQPLGDWLALGIAAKGMHAISYSNRFVLRDLPDPGSLKEIFTDMENKEGSFNFGLDAGALITPGRRLALGITGKNLNRPAFDRSGGGHVYVEPGARAGIALYPLKRLELAADLDLFHNHTLLPGYRSQILGGGVQLDLGILAVRAGVSKNIAESEEDVLLHAGLALRIWHFNLEAAAAVTPEFEGIFSADPGDMPERAGFSLTLGFNIDF